MEQDPFKVWRNPDTAGDGPRFMGDFYPPQHQVCFYANDLEALGFPPGEYTVLIPDSVRKLSVLPQWQKITVVRG